MLFDLLSSQAMLEAREFEVLDWEDLEKVKRVITVTAIGWYELRRLHRNIRLSRQRSLRSRTS